MRVEGVTFAHVSSHLHCLHKLFVVPKRIFGVMLSLPTVSSGADICMTWDTLVDDVAIDHYEVMFVVSQRPVQCLGRAVSEAGGHAGEHRWSPTQQLLMLWVFCSLKSVCG